MIFVFLGGQNMGHNVREFLFGINVHALHPPSRVMVFVKSRTAFSRPLAEKRVV